MFGRDPLTLRGRWLLIAVATVLLQFSYWPIVSSVAAASAGVEPPASGGGLMLGLSLAPLLFVLLAFGSRHERAPGAVLKAMGLFIVFAFSLALLDLMVATVAGYSAGAVAAIRREEHHSLRWRAYAAAAATAWVLVLLLVRPDFALVSGSILPFAIVGIVDQLFDDRAAEVDVAP